MTENDGVGVWKVGALADLTGLTVRALHHYDHVGLLTPSGRSPAGHRLYEAGDVARLYRICVLRRLGFALEQIADLLDDSDWQLREAVDRHLADTRSRAARSARLAARLADMSMALAEFDRPSTEELFATMEEMATVGTLTVRSAPAIT